MSHLPRVGPCDCDDTVGFDHSAGTAGCRRCGAWWYTATHHRLGQEPTSAPPADLGGVRLSVEPLSDHELLCMRKVYEDPDPGQDYTDELRLLDEHARLKFDAELKEAEHDAATEELRRRIQNQASSLDFPRVQDVMEIDRLKKILARVQYVADVSGGYVTDRLREALAEPCPDPTTPEPK